MKSSCSRGICEFLCVGEVNCGRWQPGTLAIFSWLEEIPVPSLAPFMHAQNDIFHQKCRLETPRGMVFIALLTPWLDYAFLQLTCAVFQRLYPYPNPIY